MDIAQNAAHDGSELEGPKPDGLLRSERLARRIPTIAITLIVGSFAVGNLLLMASAFL